MPGINASVGIANGKPCYNVQADQLVVQRLLSRILSSRGGAEGKTDWAAPVWKVCAPDLYQAILQFQRLNSRRLDYQPDGHVDPGGATIRLLNELADASDRTSGAGTGAGAGAGAGAGEARTAGADRSIKVLTLWLNAFISKDVKNADGSAMSFTLKTGSHAGKSAIPGPFFSKQFDDCYLTDQRSFLSTPRNASSRIHAEVSIDFTGSLPTLTPIPPLGASVNTVRVRVSTGGELNNQRGLAHGGFSPFGGFVAGSKVVTVKFDIAGKNPIAKMPRFNPFALPALVPLPPSSADPQSLADPEIDMTGGFTVDAKNRILKFDGLIDGFPFFEGYVVADGGPPVPIFQEAPEPGQSPATGLPGAANRPVKVTRRIP